VIAVDASGDDVLVVGDVDAPVFPRSCNKPLQAAAMLRLGVADEFGLEPRHIAVACASHNGEPMHIDAVRDLLARAGLDESALRNTPDLPLDVEAMRDVVRAGGAAASIWQNCSGKHALMVATCAALGWSLDGYRDPDHELQQAIRRTIEELCGESIAENGVDGCGAPVFALSLRGLARGFAAIARSDGEAEQAVANAMRAHPELVGGTKRSVTSFMTTVDGLIAKDGAEGCFAAAFADGRAAAVKIEDGAYRAAGVSLLAALRALGYDGPEPAGVRPDVLGGGEPVGAVRAVVRQEG
jgi:L-asparaginase II